MSLRRSLERLRESNGPRAVLAVRNRLEGPIGDKPLSALQISRRLAPALPIIAKNGVITSDDSFNHGLGRAIEKLYEEQHNGDE
jgi:hypothetical protein